MSNLHPNVLMDGHVFLGAYKQNWTSNSSKDSKKGFGRPCFKWVKRVFIPNLPLEQDVCNGSSVVQHHNVPPALVIMNSNPPKYRTNQCVCTTPSFCKQTLVNGKVANIKWLAYFQPQGPTDVFVQQDISKFCNLFRATCKRWAKMWRPSWPENCRLTAQIFVHWVSVNNLHHFSTPATKFRFLQQTCCQN